MGNFNKKTTETILCRKCGTVNEVDVTIIGNTNDDDYSIELAEYTECTNCKYVFTDMDLAV